MNLAVLLFYCNEAPRLSTFTREWAERAVQVSADHLYVQSGGRVTVTFKVFDWHQLHISSTEWGKFGIEAVPKVLPKFAEALKAKGEEDPRFDSYTHFLVGIDVDPAASWGTTGGKYTHLAVNSFTPQQISHELAHTFGAEDAYGVGGDEGARYAHMWDSMGSGDHYPATFPLPVLDDPSAPNLNRAGPGMTAPSLLATGWLDPNQPGALRDLSKTNAVFEPGGLQVELSALTGAPIPGSSPRLPVAIRHYDQCCEYRVRAPDGWDRAIPDPGPGVGGWLVANHSLRKEATFHSAIRVVPGETLVLGTENSFDIFNDGPLQITVMGVDAASNTVRLFLKRRRARPLEERSSIPGMGTGIDPGILVWTKGTDVVHVPKGSALEGILSGLAKVSLLQEAQLVATSAEAEVLAEREGQMLKELQVQLSELSPKA
jgi:hypothetical protein